MLNIRLRKTSLHLRISKMMHQKHEIIFRPLRGRHSAHKRSWGPKPKKIKIIEVIPISQFTKVYQNEFPSVLPSSDFNSIMDMSFYGFYIGMRSVIPQKSKTKSACIGRTSPPVDSDNCITALKFSVFSLS